jgi:hypothetical protein
LKNETNLVFCYVFAASGIKVAPTNRQHNPVELVKAQSTREFEQTNRKGNGTMADTSYTMALRQFDKAIQQLSIKAGIAELLRAPQRELIVNFPVEMDDGSVRVFTVSFR